MTNQKIYFSSKNIELLKQQARKLKKESSLSHHEALEQVAQNAGLNSWHQVTFHYESTKQAEKAYKSGYIFVLDIKDSIEMSGMNDGTVIEDTFLISQIAKSELFKVFSNSIDEDDKQERTLKETCSEEDLQDWFQDHMNNLMFFRIEGTETLTIKTMLNLVKEYSFWMPVFIWLEGKYFETFDVPSTDDDGNITGVRL